VWRREHALYPFQQTAADRMLECNVLLAFEMGCLAGDTVINLNRGGKGFNMRLDLLVERQTDGIWRPEISTMVARNVDGVRRLARLEKAWFSGMKETYEITTIEGRKIRATDEHPFQTVEGWARLDDLNRGDQVLVDAGRSKKGRTAPKAYYKQIFGMQHHPYRTWWANKYWAVPEHRMVAEADLNNMSFETFCKMVERGEIEFMSFLDPAVYAVHHIDHNHLNNAPENLMPMTHSQHHVLHVKEGKDRNVLHQIGAETILSIKKFGEEPTYDIAVEDDPHNFLANGFVVHNTGKTPTTLFTLERLRERGEIKGAGIILAPASLMYQWQREVEKFTYSVAMVLTGPPKTRQMLYLTASQCDYVIMTYDTFVRDQEEIAKRDLKAFLVLDEATAIKTFKAKRTKELKRVGGNYPIRYALTGTPIENGKPEELFSILEWVDSRITGSWWKFEKDHLIRNDFGWITGYRDILKFHKKVKPNLLRKRINDSDVSKYLPAVITPEPYEVTLDAKTRKVYQRIVDDLLADLSEIADKISVKLSAGWDSEDPDHPDGKMMAKIQTARMLLDHPVAVYSSAARFADPDDDRGSSYADELVTEGVIDGLKPVKFEAFLNYMGEFLERDEKNKAVVFCSFVDVAHAIHDALPGSVVFTGSMSPKERDAAVIKFQSDPDIRVFVSTDAGGYGLDLPQANLLVNYDMPWQAGLLKQRNARIRRASSEWKHVVVQDFIMMDTIEERLLHMLNHKIAVSEAFVDGEGVLEDGSLGSDLDTLRSFLTAISVRPALIDTI
jgi:SNF2-related domain/Intein splicing domain/Helicase conserved C-terminal domain/HNH endonuclease